MKRYAPAAAICMACLAAPAAHATWFDHTSLGYEDGGANRRLSVDPENGTGTVKYFENGYGSYDYIVECTSGSSSTPATLILRGIGDDKFVSCPPDTAGAERRPVHFTEPGGLIAVSGAGLTNWNINGVPLTVTYDRVGDLYVAPPSRPEDVYVWIHRGGLILYTGLVRDGVKIVGRPRFDPIDLSALPPGEPMTLGAAWGGGLGPAINMSLVGDGNGAWGLRVNAPDSVDGTVRDGRARWAVGGVSASVEGAVLDGWWNTLQGGSVPARVTADVSDAPGGLVNPATCDTTQTTTCTFDVTADVPSPGRHTYHLTLTAHIF